MTIPWVYSVAGGTYGDISKGYYIDNPLDATKPWTFRKIFSSPEPITATPSLSVDYFDNAWIYFGTGRLFSQADKLTTTTQYLFGIKDPFFNSPQYSASYFHDYATSKTLTPTDLFDADAYNVIYPWACDEAPVGNCSAVPAGQVGDIYSNGSCVCSYAWPSLICTPVLPADQALCDTFETDPTKVGDPDGTGRCECVAYVRPIWDCIAKVAYGCDAVPAWWLTLQPTNPYIGGLQLLLMGPAIPFLLAWWDLLIPPQPPQPLWVLVLPKRLLRRPIVVWQGRSGIVWPLPPP